MAVPAQTTPTAPLTPFNPNKTSTGAPTPTDWQETLRTTQYDPSSFRLINNATGGVDLLSGDTSVKSFSNLNSAREFSSLYSQGWQARQGTQTPTDQWNKVVEQYQWQTPNITAPTVQTTPMQPTGGETINPNSGQVRGQAPALNTTQGITTNAPVPEQISTALMKAIKSSPDMKTLMDSLAPIVGTLSGQSQIQAEQEQMKKESTVQGQMENLMKSFEGGDPPWATGPMRTANAIMAQRGLSASSMAGQAITNAVMEASLPIAMADANMSAQFQFANLNNRQQARVQNAQAFLQMDLANFSAAQQTNLFKAQERTRALLSDVSAENASRQFNAANQNQSEQFMASLASQITQFNSQQSNAMSQFNAGQTNAADQFRAQLQNQRDQFNANNRLVIDQANAQWRQQITTIENANANEANRINAANLLAVGLAEYNNISQARRDAMNYAYQASESTKDRALQLVVSQVAANTDIQTATIRAKEASGGDSSGLFKAAGSLIGSLFGK
jgi:hypothetical protein